MKQSLFYSICLLVFQQLAFSQKIDNMASFRDVGSDRYFRFSYDNDFFASSDENYTQGYNFELVAPALKKNPINYLFVKTDIPNKKYGLSIEHIGFTPFNIKDAEIQYGDRPFAAAIMLKSFRITTDTISKTRWTSSLNLGLIGPGAFGKEMQVAIHEATGNVIPQGWQNQIKNDVVVNYEVNYEKQLVRYRNLFALQSNATVRLGTLFTNASIGANAIFGIINSPFTSGNEKRKFKVYAYGQPFVNFVGYDATLQGGLFNDKSPYTIATGDVERVTGQINFGIVVQTKTLYFEYSRAEISKEFASGTQAKWGGIKFGFTF